MRLIIEENYTETLKRIDETLHGRIFGMKIDSLYLRSRSLRDKEYFRAAEYAKTVLEDRAIYVCRQLTAERLGVNLHVGFRGFNKKASGCGRTAVSVHSVEEALSAEAMGADEIMTGHIFSTECKRGVAPRGIEYLKGIVRAVKIPVIAVGGINIDNFREILIAGADIAVMHTFRGK